MLGPISIIDRQQRHIVEEWRSTVSKMATLPVCHLYFYHWNQNDGDRC